MTSLEELLADFDKSNSANKRLYGIRMHDQQTGSVVMGCPARTTRENLALCYQALLILNAGYEPDKDWLEIEKYTSSG